MDDNITNFTPYRVRATKDAKELTVADMLETTLEDSRDGQWTKMLMVLYRKDEDGTFTVDTRCAGCSTLEARGLMFSAIREEVLDSIEES